MELLKLKSNKGARHKRKRVGRGNASGHGTFCCRGMNGQSSRSGGRVRPGFEGGQTPFIQRMPKLRGFKNPNYIKYQVINVKDLEVFADKETVNKESLLAKGVITRKSLPIKLLGTGEVTKAVTVSVEAATKSAIEKVSKAKGKVELLKPVKKAKEAKPKKEAKVKEEKVEAAPEKPEAAKEKGEEAKA